MSEPTKERIANLQKKAEDSVHEYYGSEPLKPDAKAVEYENRVGVRVIDGRWPFDGSRSSGRPLKLTFVAPNSLRARRSDERPAERSTGLLACVDWSGRAARRAVGAP